MNSIELTRIRNNPSFQELERKRNVFSWSLAILMLAIYMGFVFLVAFGHDIVAQQIGTGGLTLAFPLGLGVILVAIVLTGIYVVRANSEFDRLTREVVRAAGAPSRSSAVPVGRLAEGVR